MKKLPLAITTFADIRDKSKNYFMLSISNCKESIVVVPKSFTLHKSIKDNVFVFVKPTFGEF
jgi:hypothetical protein